MQAHALCLSLFLGFIFPIQSNSSDFKGLNLDLEKEESGLKTVISEPMYGSDKNQWCVFFLLQGENEGNEITITETKEGTAYITVPPDKEYLYENVAFACYPPYLPPDNARPERVKKILVERVEFVEKSNDKDKNEKTVFYKIRR